MVTSNSPKKRAKSIFLEYWITGVWGLLILACMFVLIRYENSAAVVHERPSEWPEESGLGFANKPTLVMTLHPHCPCSRASLMELEKLLVKSSEQVQTLVLVYAPTEAKENWSDGLSMQIAKELADVTLIQDSDGDISKVFGLMTSGETALYDSDRQLLFAGGITASRGHVGANVGSSMINDLLANQKTELNTTPVFGCGIATPEEGGK